MEETFTITIKREDFPGEDMVLIINEDVEFTSPPKQLENGDYEYTLKAISPKAYNFLNNNYNTTETGY